MHMTTTCERPGLAGEYAHLLFPTVCTVLVCTASPAHLRDFATYGALAVFRVRIRIDRVGKNIQGPRMAGVTFGTELHISRQRSAPSHLLEGIEFSQPLGSRSWKPSPNPMWLEYASRSIKRSPAGYRSGLASRPRPPSPAPMLPSPKRRGTGLLSARSRGARQRPETLPDGQEPCSCRSTVTGSTRVSRRAETTQAATESSSPTAVADSRLIASQAAT